MILIFLCFVQLFVNGGKTISGPFLCLSRDCVGCLWKQFQFARVDRNSTEVNSIKVVKQHYAMCKMFINLVWVKLGFYSMALVKFSKSM